MRSDELAGDEKRRVPLHIKLLEPTSGNIFIDGEEADPQKHNLSFVFQEQSAFPWLTVEENIYFPLDLDCSTPDRKYLREIIELLGLQDKLDVFPEQLSGGQKQRAAIARALAAKPSVILADEPTGNLDSKNGQNVAGLLKMTTEIWHRTLVMVTHNQELAQMADRVIRMQDGRITEN